MTVIHLNSTYLLIEGVILAILGFFALLNPFVMSLSFEILLGSLLTVAGFVQMFRAIKDWKDSNSVVVLIGAGFTVIAGVLLLGYPFTGILTLTLLLMAYFFIDGISKIVSSIQFRPLKGWIWLLVSGLISLLLAFLILSGLPTTAIWVIGMYVGIYLLFLGTSFMMLSFNIKKERR